MLRISAFKWVPEFAQGLVRDLRVRWALEEAGLPYEVRLLSHEDKLKADYLSQQPFGQVPVLEEGNLCLFESGSIVLYVAEKSATLWPQEKNAQARARTWVFAAINSIEPFIQQLATIDLFHPKDQWAQLRRPGVVELVEKRLTSLENWMANRDYLEGTFTVGDLMMVSVLRILRHTAILEKFPKLTAYKARVESRPAFQKALADQLKVFAENPKP